MMSILPTGGDSPYIDETFDPAFASIAILNEVMTRSTARPWDNATSSVRDAGPIADAMLKCFDEQIDDMGPDPGVKMEQRVALVAELERFAGLWDTASS